MIHQLYFKKYKKEDSQFLFLKHILCKSQELVKKGKISKLKRISTIFIVLVWFSPSTIYLNIYILNIYISNNCFNYQFINFT